MSSSSQSAVCLPRGQVESARREPLGRQVELAHPHRVLAAVREVHQAARIAGRRAVGALPHPIGPFRRRQRVEIQHRLPGRGRAGVALRRRAPPKPAHMGRILPEIIDRAADQFRGGDTIGGVDDREGLGMEHPIAGIALQHRQGAGILFFHPRQGARALDGLEPEIGVAGRVVHEGRLRMGGSGNGGEGRDDEGWAHGGFSPARPRLSSRR